MIETNGKQRRPALIGKAFFGEIHRSSPPRFAKLRSDGMPSMELFGSPSLHANRNIAFPAAPVTVVAEGDRFRSPPGVTASSGAMT
jgi:hypothetical protein